MNEREWVQQESERLEAVDEAAEALGLKEEYEVRLMYTSRVSYEETMFAVSLDDLKEQIIRARYDLEDNEGDEIAYVNKPGSINADNPFGEEHEFDLRTDNEPFSWSACAIIKDMACTDPNDHAALKALHERAVAACKKD